MGLHEITVEQETRNWGEFVSLLEFGVKNGKKVKVKILSIKEGGNLSYQRHFKRNELWFLAEGEIHVVIGEDAFLLEQGAFVTIPQGDWHSALGISDESTIVEIQFGDECEEDDIQRLHIEWLDIVQNVLTKKSDK